MTKLNLQTAFTVNQNTNVAYSAISNFAYDYNFTFLACSDQTNPTGSATHSLNSLFTTATYIQDPNNANSYNVNLVLNKPYLISLISNPLASETPIAGQYKGGSTLMTNMSQQKTSNLGNFLLQVIAIKLFGNATAVAAILNDTDFTSSTMYSTLVDGLANSITTDANFIFGQYVQAGKINVSENDFTLQKFNFDDTSLSFPIYLNGTIPTALGSILQNGSSLVTVGSQITNFAYNIPLLLTIDGLASTDTKTK